MDTKLTKTFLLLFVTLQIIKPSLSTKQNFVGNYEFLAKFKIGTPPREVKTVISTGTGLTLIQCEPCDSCWTQTDPIFNPHNSTSFNPVQCKSDTCRSIDGAGCDRNYQCAFNEEDPDGSATEGILATENFEYNDQKFSNFMFGCAHGSSKRFDSSVDGVLGLDMSKESFVNQYENLTHGRFSYCLPKIKNGDAIAQLNFGANTKVLGDFTLIKVSPTEQGLYYVTLVDVSVGLQKLNVRSGSFEMDRNGNGGTLIDSATMVSLLSQPAYNRLVGKLKEMVKLAPAPQPIDAQLSFCFKGTESDLVASKIPDLTFHFEGLNVTVPPSNSFVSTSENTVCLAVLPSADVSVFGGILQQNLNVAFDVKQMKIYVKSADCAQA